MAGRRQSGLRARAAWLALGAVVSATPAAAGCKLALVLGLDISSSVNSREYRIQLGGLAQAFRTPEVQRAILTPPGDGIAVHAFEWSGANQQATIIDWTMLDTLAKVEAFADRLAGHRRTASTLPTAVGEALAHGARQFARGPACDRRTVDISGDGENNDGPHPAVYRAAGAFDGITINGLVIQGAYPNPAIYYRRQVMHGPGAFVALARDFDDYPAVIVGKLLQEIGTEMVIGDVR